MPITLADCPTPAALRDGIPARHAVQLHPFGSAPDVVPEGYRLSMEVRGTEATLRQHYAGKDVVLVRSAEPAVEPGQIVVGVFVWQPAYARRSDGDWQVTNLRYPDGGTARVSNRYPDRKWRIVNDKRRTAINAPGDFTYPTRDAAARAERECLLRASAPATA